jgi:SAM-dependent methyltransferase
VVDVDHHPLTARDWEAAWAAYDDDTYQAALACIERSDVVLDIGAGDLRFARRAARRARHVFAIERNPALLTRVPRGTRRLTVLCADALKAAIPRSVTVAVLLMRHCQHFAEYVFRLRAAGCQRLITNARWGMGVECLSLAPQPTYCAAGPGWYACICGRVGFKLCPPECITADLLQRDQSLENCPACSATA